MNVERFSLPLSEPLATAAGTIDERTGLLVSVTVDGTEGLGEATPLAGWTESLEDCHTVLETVTDPATAIVDGTLADHPAARHGVSLALLDARARAAGRPLYRHLGGSTERHRVPVNATVGDGDVETTRRAAVRSVDDGYRALKVKVGARAPSVDRDRIAAVRDRCPDVELRADANGAWDRETAARMLSAFATQDVTVVEQPLAADDLRGHARLRDGPVGVALDESLVDRSIDAVLDADAADVVVCKPMALGGVDAARDVAVRAQQAGLAVVVTTTVDGAVARAAAVHLAASLPTVPACGLATGDRLAADLQADVAPIEDGRVLVPQGKGNIPPR